MPLNITIDNVRKDYDGRTVLSIAELTIERGEIVGLVGNNGAGKTTLLRLILDLVRSSKGMVRIGGNEVSTSEEWKKHSGAYLDEGFLIDYLTPREYLSLVASTRGVGEGDLADSIERWGDFLDGEERSDRKTLIRDLSKGTVQKIGITSALLGDPQIVLLDEPFANLDPTSQSRLKEILSRQRQRTGALILLSSHNLRHVVDFCTRILLLDHGKVARDVTVGDDSARLLGELERHFAVRTTEYRRRRPYASEGD